MGGSRKEYEASPDRRAAKRAWDAANSDRLRVECPRCGVRRMRKGRVRCMECRRGEHVRRMLLLERLWNAGEDRRDIAAAIGCQPEQMSRYVAWARHEGYEMAYRKRVRPGDRAG